MENQQLTAQTAKELSAGIAVKTGTVGANWHQIDAKFSNSIGPDGRAETWRISPNQMHLGKTTFCLQNLRPHHVGSAMVGADRRRGIHEAVLVRPSLRRSVDGGILMELSSLQWSHRRHRDHRSRAPQPVIAERVPLLRRNWSCGTNANSRYTRKQVISSSFPNREQRGRKSCARCADRDEERRDQ